MNLLKTSISTLLLCFSSIVFANSIIDIVVPNPPGGTTDIIGRYISKILQESNIPNVVINKPGAQGTLGTKFVATTANKDSTLLILGTGPGMYAPLTMKEAPYDVQQDFEFIATVATDPIVVVVPGESAIQDLPSLVSKLRNNQSTLRWGHGATSQRFAGFSFLDRVQSSGVEVPYNGANPVVIDVAGNRLDFAFVNYTEAKEMAQSGRIKIIAIASNKRHAQAPTIKTFNEQGVKFEMQAWFLLVGPKGISADTVSKINQVISKFSHQDRDSWVSTNMNVYVGTPEQASEFIKSQYQQHQNNIKKLNLNK